MSWVEVSKINSDFDTSLDLWFKMNDICMYGDKSIILENDDDMTKLFYNLYAINKELIYPYIFEFGCSHNLNVGRCLKNIHDIGTFAWDSLKAVSDVVNNKDAITLCMNNERAWNIMMSSETFIRVMGASTTVIKVLEENAQLLDKFLTNELAMDSIGSSEKVLSEIVKSDTLRRALIAHNSVLQKAQNTFFTTLINSTLFECTESERTINAGTSSLSSYNELNRNAIHLVSAYGRYNEEDYVAYVNHGLGGTAGSGRGARDDATKRFVAMCGSRLSQNADGGGMFIRWKFELKETMGTE